MCSNIEHVAINRKRNNPLDEKRMSGALIYSTGVARYALCIPWLLSLGRFIDKRKKKEGKKQTSVSSCRYLMDSYSTRI